MSSFLACADELRFWYRTTSDDPSLSDKSGSYEDLLGAVLGKIHYILYSTDEGPCTGKSKVKVKYPPPEARLWVA